MDVLHFKNVAKWILDELSRDKQWKKGIWAAAKFWLEIDNDFLVHPYGFAASELRDNLEPAFKVISSHSTTFAMENNPTSEVTRDLAKVFSENKSYAGPRPPFPAHFFVAQARAGPVQAQYTLAGRKHGLKLRELLPDSEYTFFSKGIAEVVRSRER